MAADASVLAPAIRRCPRRRGFAEADQRQFALHLPGARLMLQAAMQSASGSARAMLANALDVLQHADVLLLDRGCPAVLLVHLLNAREISSIMRCDTLRGSWRAVLQFMREGLAETQVRLNALSKRDAADWGCSVNKPEVRLVRRQFGAQPHSAPKKLVAKLWQGGRRRRGWPMPKWRAMPAG